MDAGAFFVLGAWAPLLSQKQCRPASPPDPAPGKVPLCAPSWRASSKPVSASKPVSVCPSSKAACMRGPAHDLPQPDPAKSATRYHPEGVKAASSDDDAAVGFGLRRPVGVRRGAQGSSPQLASSPGAATGELPTVAEVLRTAKMLLAPAQAVERQFYADCYRACQVAPASRPAASAASPPSPPDASSPFTAMPPPPPLYQQHHHQQRQQQHQQHQHQQPALPYLTSVPEVALRLSCLGHRVVLRRVTDTKQYWSKSMTNTFCYVVLPGTGIGYVLDPGFREHFRAGSMSDRYRDIWECLPPLFVGPPAKLVQLVQLLCAELGASFEGAGRQLPPWRTFNATIQRWMSPVFRDLPAPQRRPASAGSGAGAGPSMIPAAEAQAFLRASEELLAGTASAPMPSAAGAATAPAARSDPRVAGSRAGSAGAADADAAGLASVPGTGMGSGRGSADAPQRTAAHPGGTGHNREPPPPQQQQQEQQQEHRRRVSLAGAGGQSSVAGPLARLTLTGFQPPTQASNRVGDSSTASVDTAGAVAVAAAAGANRGGSGVVQAVRPAQPHHAQGGGGGPLSPSGASPAGVAPVLGPQVLGSTPAEASVCAAGAAAGGAIAAAAAAPRAPRPAEGLLSRSLRPQRSLLRQPPPPQQSWL